MSLKEIIEENKEFLGENSNAYFSPGRVNLIGEHIDYLGGNVFPTAINLGTYALVSKRDDMEFHFLSHNFKSYGEKIVTLDNLIYDEERNWANYPTGVLASLIEKGLKVTNGLNILIYGTLPNGAGLSSSASLEVLMGTLLRDEFHFEISMLDIVKISKQVENEYVGVNCGIMDQFAVGMSKENTAIYLNTDTLSYELVPLVLGDYTLVITNTNKKRALSESKYNERRNECDLGLEKIKELGFTVSNLCDLTEVDLDYVLNKITEVNVRNRVEHAVRENARTKKAVTALSNKDLQRFGKLMNRSHDSLRDLFEVSCYELDTLVDAFRKYGAIGSRMTGAGFGGCTISLVETKKVAQVIENVKNEYKEHVGYDASFYTCKTSDGARSLTKEEIK